MSKPRVSVQRSPVVSITDLPPGAHLLEGDFQEPLKRVLNQAGRNTRVWRQNCGTVQTRDRAGKRTGQFSAGPRPGAADLSGAVAPWGIRIEIECKVDAPHEPNQKMFQESVERLGCLYCLVRYDHALSLVDNVAAGVALVDAAIAARVAALVSCLTSAAAPSV